ncbi:MAG: redoxin family protein [Bacteroidota bacterium]
MAFRELLPQTLRARELYGDFWFNSEPVPISALRGQVILLEFWDYSCAASLRTLPYVLEWRRRYSPYGFVVVGVHTPRFQFGKDVQHVQRGIARLGVDFPVVMDNEALIAAHYDFRAVPEIVLIDKDGFVRYRSTGDGSYASIEHAIQALLYNAGVGEPLPLVMDPLREADREGVVCFRSTPELYAGYARGSIGNVEGYSPESVVRYSDPGLYLDGRFYAAGDWFNGRECLRVEGGGEENPQLIFDYLGVEAEGVLLGGGAHGAEISVVQDDAYLSPEIRGEDVRTDDAGRSYLVVAEPRLYRIVRNREYGEHILRLRGSADPVSAFAFSFTTAPIPELVSKN